MVAKFTVLDIKPVLVQRMGIIPTSVITPPFKFFRTWGDYYLWISLFAFLISSILFVAGNYDDINPTLKTIPMIIGGCQSLGMFLSVGLRSDMIATLREKLQAIVEAGAPTVFSYLF